MTSFRYRALDQEGNPVEGTLEEESAQAAVEVLQARGLTVNAVDPMQAPSRALPRKERLSWNDLDQFNQQLLAVTQGRLPLAPSLAALTQDLRSSRLRAVLEDVRQQLEAGSTLDDALARHPHSFSPVYRALVRAGEHSGNLAGVFSLLGRYSTRWLELKGNMQQALAYPLLLIVAAILLFEFLMIKVVPVFADVFKDFGKGLPAPTQFVVDLSRFLQAHLAEATVLGLVLAAGAIYLTRSLLATESGGYVTDAIKLRLPVFGRIYENISLARFCRALGLLLEARVSLLDSVDLAAAASGNVILAAAAQRAGQLVAGGETFAAALRQTRYFGSSFCWMVQNAEQRGEIDATMKLLADDFERNVERRHRWLLMLAPALVVLAIGFGYGFVILSLYLPIFSLGDAISGN